MALNSEDYTLINNLLKTEKSIKKIYNELTKLEIDGKKDSKEYKKYLDYLSIARETEVYSLNKLKLNEEKCFDVIRYLVDDRVAYDNKNIKISDEIKRICLILIRFIIHNMDKTCIEITKDEKRLLNLFEKGNNYSLVSESLYDCFNLENYIDNDFYTNYLSFIEKFIIKSKDKYEKEGLIKTKYNSIYINKDVEDYLIKNDFEIGSELYLFSKHYAEFNDICYENYNLILSMRGKNIILKNINKLLNISNKDYNNSNKKIEISNIKSQILSAILFLNEKGLKILKTCINDLIMHKDSNYNKSIKEIKAIILGTEEVNAEIKELKRFNSYNILK